MERKSAGRVSQSETTHAEYKTASDMRPQSVDRTHFVRPAITNQFKGTGAHFPDLQHTPHFPADVIWQGWDFANDKRF